MIRNFKETDLKRVMKIWLVSNLEAHSFINPDCWQERFASAARAISQAEVYVFERDGEIIGFLGIKNRHIEGLFVDGEHRSSGVGKALLDHAKERHPKLTLCVYKRNARAENFYRREGFMPVREQLDVDTCETEIFMKWENGDIINEKYSSYRKILSP